MREEYKLILDAGLLLQVDDPSMVSAWDSRLDLSLEEYRQHARKARRAPQLRAARPAPGPHPLPHVLRRQLWPARERPPAGARSSTSSSRSTRARTRSKPPIHVTNTSGALFETVELPEGKGADSRHGDPLQRHDRASAGRRGPHRALGETVGAENLIVGNDCGFASTAGNAEIPPTVAWAKLQALGEGARLASERLYARIA